LGQGVNLLVQQGIGALQFAIAHQQALYTLSNLIDLGLIRHKTCIVEMSATGVMAAQRKISALVLAVWFTRRSSTGSRGVRFDAQT
jgi:hypothetical protein